MTTLTKAPNPRAARERYEAARAALDYIENERYVAQLEETHGEFRSREWWRASDADRHDAEAALKQAMRDLASAEGALA